MRLHGSSKRSNTWRQEKPNQTGKSQLIRDLKNGEFATLYIISGEESYMKEYYLRQLRQKVVDETFADFNLIEFEGKGLTPEMLTEAIDSYPAMADKKLIIVKDFDLFKPPAGFADVLPGVLGDLPEYVCLVFYYDVLDGKPDKRTKLYRHSRSAPALPSSHTRRSRSWWRGSSGVPRRSAA
mgnify:CR=1 FL=1